LSDGMSFVLGSVNSLLFLSLKQVQKLRLPMPKLPPPKPVKSLTRGPEKQKERQRI